MRRFLDTLAGIMGGALIGALGASATVAVVFLIICLSTLFGALGGWVVGLFFGETILTTLSRFGADVNGLAMWQLGATLGFVGSFFKASLGIKK